MYAILIGLVHLCITGQFVFEAKHRLLKQLSTRMGNFKNLALSLASRHQSLQCYLLKENAPLLKAIECGPGK